MILIYPLCVGESRKDWPQYDDNMAGRDQWTADLIENYKQQLKLDMKTGKLHLKETVTPELIAGSLVERYGYSVARSWLGILYTGFRCMGLG